MHDLRQRHCPIITSPRLVTRLSMLTILHSLYCQPACKIVVKKKISYQVRLLACDLVWKVCVPSPPPVNMRESNEYFVPRAPRMMRSFPQYRSTIRSSFLLSSQDKPRNATSITMPRPEEALLMAFSEN